jgi:hypothetical protein
MQTNRIHVADLSQNHQMTPELSMSTPAVPGTLSTNIGSYSDSVQVWSGL